MARALLELGRRDDARKTLDGLLTDAPDHPEAKQLRQQVGG